MNNVNLTEKQFIDKLVAVAKAEGETAPRAIVIERVVTNPERSLQRKVRVALIVTSNNTSLMDALIKECLDNDLDFYFVGSEVNLQNDMEIDYLYFEAKIMLKQ